MQHDFSTASDYATVSVQATDATPARAELERALDSIEDVNRVILCMTQFLRMQQDWLLDRGHYHNRSDMLDVAKVQSLADEAVKSLADHVTNLQHPGCLCRSA
ncbi:hypothetical protein [Motiliproteus sediminis]|uniref:hypothetical protein n=1 Tax=Motiliproteus sediminis TaxID=1468178 RepID=UPI001AEFD8C3|nr:hypothetical protein [Motiliproteus sediminis]